LSWCWLWVYRRYYRIGESVLVWVFRMHHIHIIYNILVGCECGCLHVGCGCTEGIIKWVNRCWCGCTECINASYAYHIPSTHGRERGCLHVGCGCTEGIIEWVNQCWCGCTECTIYTSHAIYTWDVSVIVSVLAVGVQRAL